MQKKVKGKYGEEIAANYLIKKGYKILETNFRFSRFGEVDIIAEHNALRRQIVFIEVKTRSDTDFGHPFEAIGQQKMQKIFQCAQAYLAQLRERKEPYGGFQIDAISILLNEKPPKIQHLENLEVL